MGCDISSFAEKRNKKTNKWEQAHDAFSCSDYVKTEKKQDSPFNHRNYSVFGFLADVRNYDCCEPLSQPKGLPDDVSMSIKEDYDNDYECIGIHSASYLTLKELLEFDYDKVFWNRRVSRNTYRADGSISGSNGACLAEEGEGEMISYRENLGEQFFIHLEELKQIGEPEDVRIVFWFDN